MVKNILYPQRQFLLTELSDYLQQLSEKTSAEIQPIVEKYDTPWIVKQISEICQLETTVSVLRKYILN